MIAVNEFEFEGDRHGYGDLVAGDVFRFQGSNEVFLRCYGGYEFVSLESGVIEEVGGIDEVVGVDSLSLVVIYPKARVELMLPDY